MSQRYVQHRLFPYLLAVFSVYLLISKSSFIPWSILAFIVVSTSVIDKRYKSSENTKRYIFANKRLDFVYRLFLSISVLFIMMNLLVLKLGTISVLYVLLLLFLTSILLFTSHME
ncbi:hypothetical protein COL65_21550 [Priestia aryabhattai]|nr:hypothetical protein C2I28_16490 [Priestia megaterium]PGA15474.1 hypothetical protein COL65_21550 [Priestia aryabhattai]